MEMSVKIIIKYHHTPIRMTKIRKTDYTKCLRGYEGNGRLAHILLVRMQNGATTLGNNHFIFMYLLKRK